MDSIKSAVAELYISFNYMLHAAADSYRLFKNRKRIIAEYRQLQKERSHGKARMH